jgi:hypothetical protein
LVSFFLSAYVAGVKNRITVRYFVVYQRKGKDNFPCVKNLTQKDQVRRSIGEMREERAKWFGGDGYNKKGPGL